jgi:hypothetical protein
MYKTNINVTSAKPFTPIVKERRCMSPVIQLRAETQLVFRWQAGGLPKMPKVSTIGPNLR